MRTLRPFLVPLLFSLCAAAQTPGTNSTPQPAAGLQPGVATPMAPAPDPITRSTPPITRQTPQQPQPKVNLQVPLPQRALVRRIAMIDIPGRPGFKDVVFTHGCLVMAHPAASTVDVFDVRKRRVIAQIKDMEGASGVAADEAGGRVFVANSDGKEIAVISIKNWQVEKRILLTASPDRLLFVPATNTLYAGNWRDQSLSIIDVQQGMAVNTVAVDGRPEYLVYDPASKQIFVSLEDLRQVAVLDPTLKVVKRYPLAASMPTGLALDVTARRLYVAVRNAVVELDADSGRELRRVAAPEGIDALWLDASGGNLYGAASGGTIVLLKAGKGVFEAEREYTTDVRGNALAFDAATRRIYLPGGRDGRSKLLILRRIQPGEPFVPELARK